MVADVDDLVFEVDVLPGEAEEFAEAHTGVERGDQERLVAREAAGEEAFDLIVVEDALFAALVAWPFVLFEPEYRVATDVTATDGVVEDPIERDESAADRLA